MVRVQRANELARLERYLARLPDGLASYPDLQAKASIYRGALDKLTAPFDPTGLPEALVPYVVEPVPRSVWIPEVVNSALYLAMADRFFPTDEAFLDWIEAISAEVFRSPLYRMLMLVASPRRLALGAERRWSAFHQGTSYRVEVGHNGSHARFEFPPFAYDELAMRGSVRAIQTAYRATGARNATYELVGFGPTWAAVRSVWYPEREGVT